MPEQRVDKKYNSGNSGGEIHPSNLRAEVRS
jgi:hypothetical protein